MVQFDDEPAVYPGFICGQEELDPFCTRRLPSRGSLIPELLQDPSLNCFYYTDARMKGHCKRPFEGSKSRDDAIANIFENRWHGVIKHHLAACKCDANSPSLFPLTMMFQVILYLSFCLQLVSASNSSAPSPTSLSFSSPPGYSSKVYNVSAATTTLTYSYSDEELALLWDQVGPIQVGPITTTVKPTPEPTAYPRPGVFHPQVCVLLREATTC